MRMVVRLNVRLGQGGLTFPSLAAAMASFRFAACQDHDITGDISWLLRS